VSLYDKLAILAVVLAAIGFFAVGFGFGRISRAREYERGRERGFGQAKALYANAAAANLARTDPAGIPRRATRFQRPGEPRLRA
jgi:hypothetical protein